MNTKVSVAIATFALIGWIATASASPVGGGGQNPPGYQLAQNDHKEMSQKKEKVWDWYQGQRGQWRKDKDDNQWRWRGADNDQWYQGHPGHWYQEQNGWQFNTPDLICNNAGRNCRRGGYLPPNGEGMVSRTNPRMFWHCDSEGHNCNWARRPM
jgi:hypothetical protein